MATGLVAYDNTNGEKASKGGVSTNRIAGTVYATSLDLSSTITVGTATLSSSRLDPGSSGTFDIGTTSVMPTGIGGNSITITGQSGGPSANPIGSGRGGGTTLKGGTGGLGDAVQLGGDGGDAYIEGGIAGGSGGAGVGTKGKVYLGQNDTLSIVVGTDVLPSGASLDIGSSASPFDYGYFNDVRMMGASGSDILWNTNGGGDIGAAGPSNAPANIYATTMIKAGASTALKSDRLSITGANGDPGTLIAGDLWYHTGTGKLRYYNGASSLDLSTGSAGIPDPGTKANNDLLQYKLGTTTWDAVGGAVGDPVLGTLYTSALTIVGTGNASPLLWNTDNANDIGALATTRPRTGYFGTEINIDNSSQRFRSDRISMKANSSEPATLAEGDYWYQSGHLKYRDGTLARHTNPGRLGKKYYAGTVAAASGEVTILSYNWAAGELDNDRSLLRAKILAVGDIASYIRVKTYYTTNGGAGWNGMLSVDGVGTVQFSLFDLIVASYPSNTNYCTHWWRGLNFTESANGLYNTGVNWFAGSGSNYGIKITLENRTNGATFNVRAWLYEDRTPTA